MTVAGVRMLMTRGGGYEGIVQSVIYGQTKGIAVLEVCNHRHKLMRTARACARTMLHDRAARARRR